MMPRFSVIVPTRNRPASLAATLHAIKRQTCRSCEVIVVDDGSSAECRARYGEMLASLDDRFQIVCDTPDGSPGRGPSAARNRALSLAQGEFVTFCDDDDLWSADDHLEVASKALSAVPDADIYYANQESYRGNNLIDTDRWPQLHGKIDRAARIGTADVYRVPRTAFMRPGGVAHLNVSIVRRSLSEEIGGFWDLVRYEEDLDFYLRSIDRARTILFRPTIVAQHYAPDPRRQDNASTLPNTVEKWLVRAMICEHVRVSARTSEVLARACAIHGYALQHLATALSQNKQHEAAFVAAAQALAVLPGLRWSTFVRYLALRRLSARVREAIGPIKTKRVPAV
jgi:cellulose synthase/poly-beta-1,6-N-acetylglucosamine synthase-like glycosyltransferase